jgi:hypothetical protein
MCQINGEILQNTRAELHFRRGRTVAVGFESNTFLVNRKLIEDLPNCDFGEDET